MSVSGGGRRSPTTGGAQYSTVAAARRTLSSGVVVALGVAIAGGLASRLLARRRQVLRVEHPHQVQPVRWRGRSRAPAVAGRQHLGDPPGQPIAVADLEQRTYDAAHHVVEEPTAL